MKENETDITDINHLIHAAATVIAETIARRGKTVKHIRNKDIESKDTKANKQLVDRTVHTCLIRRTVQ
jgi:hypothetical protein